MFTLTTPFWAELKPSTSINCIGACTHYGVFFNSQKLMLIIYIDIYVYIYIYYATVNCWCGQGRNLLGLSWSIFKHVTCWNSYCHKVLLRQSKSVCFSFVNVVRTTIWPWCSYQERWVLARCCRKSQTWKSRQPTSILYSKALLDVASWMVFY